MATVHLAVLCADAGFRKLVALKQPNPGLSQDAEFLEMFMNEARLAARLNHPNVVQTYEVGQHAAEPFIAMEFLEGQPLHRLQHAAPAGIPLAIHLRIIAETLAGLHHAHELRDFSGAPLSVVHRDVSPQNVLVGYDGHAKVVDFGIAKATTLTSFTSEGMVKGKVPYMSPEQMLGEHLDRRADVFAIGVMLWEAASGRRLWPGESIRSRLRMLSRGDIPRFDATDHPACPELERICRRALEYWPERRYQTAAELEADLEALRGEPGLRATRGDVTTFMLEHFEGSRKHVQKLIEVELGQFSLHHAQSKYCAAPPLARMPIVTAASELTVVSGAPPTGSSQAPRSINRRRLGLLLATGGAVAILTLNGAVRIRDSDAPERSVAVARPLGSLTTAPLNTPPMPESTPSPPVASASADGISRPSSTTTKKPLTRAPRARPRRPVLPQLPSSPPPEGVSPDPAQVVPRSRF